MQKNEDIWYRIGFALESARQRADVLDSRRDEEEGTAPRNQTNRKLVRRGRKGGQAPLDEASRKLKDAVLTVGAGTALSRLLAFWPGSRKPGLFRLGKAGAAGAAAAFLTGLLHPVLTPEEAQSLEEDLTDILLSGAGRGLLYAAIVEPRIPGPGLLQGTVYGALEWALMPWGGLEELAGPAAPQGKVPVLSALLRGREKEEQLLEHLLFGIVLALLYQD